MFKSVKEIQTKLKGAGNEAKTLPGKKSFSSSAFDDLVHAMVNDPDYRFTSVDRSGKKVDTNIRSLIVEDLKKSAQSAGYPQKTEAGVYDTAEISTKGFSRAIRPIATEYIRTARKFSLEPQEDFTGDIYLAKVPAGTKTVNVRDIKTGVNIGTTTIIRKDSVQVRAKSPVPKHLVEKVRKDASGKVLP